MEAEGAEAELHYHWGSSPSRLLPPYVEITTSSEANALTPNDQYFKDVPSGTSNYLRTSQAKRKLVEDVSSETSIYSMMCQAE
eukprot:6046157-Pyramimonas_sp.AAC.1